MLNNFVFPLDNTTALHVAAYYNNTFALALLLRNKVKCPFLSTTVIWTILCSFFLYLFDVVKIKIQFNLVNKEEQALYTWGVLWLSAGVAS